MLCIKTLPQFHVWHCVVLTMENVLEFDPYVS